MAEKPRLKDTDAILESLGTKTRKKKAANPRTAAKNDNGADQKDIMQQQDEINAAKDINDDEQENDMPNDKKPLDFGKYQLPKTKEKKASAKSSKKSTKADKSKAEDEKQVLDNTQDEFVPLELSDVKEQKSEKEKAPNKEKIPEKTEEEKQREAFIQQLSSKFEQQFSRKFYGDDGEIVAEEPLKEVADRIDEPKQAKKKSELIEADFKQEEPAEEKIISSDGVTNQKDISSDDIKRAEEILSMLFKEEIEKNNVNYKKEEVKEASNLFYVEENDADIEKLKDELTEKFMREREQYLDELGINDYQLPNYEDLTAEPQSPRKKLDFKIQPEMHMTQEEFEEKAKTAPISYSPTAKAIPFINFENTDAEKNESEAAVDEKRDVKGAAFAPFATPTEDKAVKSEKLLMELGELIKAKERVQATKKAPKGVSQFDFTFATPEKQAEDALKKAASIRKPQPKRRPVKSMHMGTAAVGSAKARRINPNAKAQSAPNTNGEKGLKIKTKLPRSIIAMMTGAAVITMSLVGWSISRIVDLKGIDEVPEALPQMQELDVETLEIYMSRNFEESKEVDSAVIKRSDVSLSNLAVRSKLVIDEISSPGSVSLSDVNVDGMIYIKSGGVNELNLKDVNCSRIVLNNSLENVKINLSGNSSVGTIEARTSIVLTQKDLTDDAMGVSNMIIKTEEKNSPTSAELRGVDLISLSAENAVNVNMDNKTSIENVTADGVLSLAGAGKVVNLSMDNSDESDKMSLLVKDTKLSHLNVIAPGNINLAAQVDTVASASPMFIGGSGSVGSMTLNPALDGSRIVVEVAGLNIQTLTNNAKATVTSAGSSRINTLIANDSTYTLGNKLNHLQVNSNGVIYENNPDKISVKNGIEPPQSKAENPNLDYMGNYNTMEVAGTASQTDDGISTTCGHSRESGGFITGDGSVNSPFEISNAAQLAHINDHLDSYFIQTADIDISADSKFANGFTMIAADGKPFSGVYDGNGFKIINLNISSDKENIGLFAENTGTIKNVHITSGTVKSITDQRVFIGSIAGLNYQGGVIEHSSNGASVSGAGASYVGGIAGYNYGGKIRETYNTAKIEGQDVAGGIVGMNRENANLSSSYNVGTVTGDSQVGSVVGVSENAVITNCYFLEGSAELGIGSGSGSADVRTEEQLMAAQAVSELSAGTSDSKWTQSTLSNYKFPVIR